MKISLIVVNPFGSDEQDFDCVRMFQAEVDDVNQHLKYFNQPGKEEEEYTSTAFNSLQPSL